MPRKKESSDEYEPEGLGGHNSSDEGSQSEDTQMNFDEPLTERKAKINRKEIVESEDSDKLSSEGENSDDYVPGAQKKSKNLNFKHQDSDSDDGPAYTPSPPKAVRKRPIRKKRRVKKWESSEDSASSTSEDEAQTYAKYQTPQKEEETLSPIDQLEKKFTKVPRSDITRVYYQMSCQLDRTEKFLTENWRPDMFQKITKPQNDSDPKLSESGSGSGSDSDKEKGSGESGSEKENVQLNLNSDSEDSMTKKNPKKRKVLNSSDEEWCPMPKKQKKFQKKVLKRISSEDDDEQNEVGDQDSDAIDEDYSGPEEVKRSKEAELKIFKFLNTATEAEMMTVKGLSEKKAKGLIEIRPFNSFAHMRKTIYEAKAAKIGNFDSLCDATDELLKGRELVKTLLKRCEKLSRTLTQLLETNDGGLSMEKPECMSEHLTLKPYQKRGLHWLTLIHSQKISGILADEMGLGKTVQSIAFLGWLKTTNPNFTRPHLVVCPSSTLENWKREFDFWLPSFKIHTYHGEHRRHMLRKIIKAKSGENGDVEIPDVMITTYQSCVAHENDRVAIKKLGVGYAIFDEGHMLKNMSTQRYQQLMRIGARRRLLLTGTPLQNNLLELISLLKFIMPDLLQKSSATLNKIFKLRNSESDFAKQRVKEAKTILQPFVLRRVKSDVLRDLPPKIEENIIVPMTDEQSMFYNEIRNSVRKNLSNRISGVEEAGKRKLLNEFMQLRKCANHPLLHRNHYTPDILRKMARLLCQKELSKDGNVEYVFEDFEVMSDFQIHQTCEKYDSLRKFKLKKDKLFTSGKFKKLDTLLPNLFEKGHRVVLFSQFVIMMDIMERYLAAREIRYLRLDGSTPVEQRLELIDEFNTDYEIGVFMISTKAGGLGINLTSADTVIIHDIDPNPYNDKQAEDRCHRVGQTKEVRIIRLLTKDSIELRMRQLAEEKLKLESRIACEDKMVYKRRSIDEPVKEEDSDSNDGPNEEEIMNLLQDDLPLNKPSEDSKKDMTVENGKSDVKEEKPEAPVEKEPLKELSPNQTPVSQVEAS